MRIETQRDLYPLQYESAERSTQQLLKSCDLLDKLWKKLLTKSTPKKTTPKKQPVKRDPRKSPSRQENPFKTPEGQVLLIVLDELKKNDWDLDKALQSLQTKTKGLEELQKATQEVVEVSKEPVSEETQEKFGSNPEEILDNLDNFDSTVGAVKTEFSGSGDESKSESSPESDSESTSDTESDSSGGSEVDEGQPVTGTDKDGNEYSGEVVQMAFGRPMIETDSGDVVTLTKWSTRSDDYSLFF